MVQPKFTKPRPSPAQPAADDDDAQHASSQGSQEDGEAQEAEEVLNLEAALGKMMEDSECEGGLSDAELEGPDQEGEDREEDGERVMIEIHV